VDASFVISVSLIRTVPDITSNNEVVSTVDWPGKGVEKACWEERCIGLKMVFPGSRNVLLLPFVMVRELVQT